MFVSHSHIGFVYPNQLRMESDRTKVAYERSKSSLSLTIAEQSVKITSLKGEVKRLKAELAAQTALLEAERAKNETLANSMLNHFKEWKEGSATLSSGHYKLNRQQKMTE